MMFLVQTMRINGWQTVDNFFEIEKAFDKADMLCQFLCCEVRVFEPITRATYYMPELPSIEIHGLKIR